jgi:drug/metabolite transporter superfamily protein YnfA
MRFMDFQKLYPAGRAYCAWGGHFVTFILVLAHPGPAVLPLVGTEMD